MVIPKISLETITQFFNSRNQRDKVLLIGVGVILALTIDVLFFVEPGLNTFFKNQPELEALSEELRGLERDQMDEKKIESELKVISGRAVELDHRCAISSEASAENLSVFAQGSGVKILSLTPSEKLKSSLTGAFFIQSPIKINASAGLHAFGNFLAKIENSPLFFRITRLTVKEDPIDIRNHQIEMSVECYQKI